MCMAFLNSLQRPLRLLSYYYATIGRGFILNCGRLSNTHLQGETPARSSKFWLVRPCQLLCSMGKKQHSKDQLYLTRTEHDSGERGGGSLRSSSMWLCASEAVLGATKAVAGASKAVVGARDAVAGASVAVV